MTWKLAMKRLRIFPQEEIAIHEDLCTSLELFNLATKCARAEEGRLSLLELLATDLKRRKPKPRT